MANLTCPYCLHAATFAFSKTNVRGRLGDPTEDVWVGLSKCPGCGGVVAIANGQHNVDSAKHFIPRATVPPPDPRIPTAIAADLLEARKCYSVGALKATAVIARRAVQGACVDQGANPKKTLHDQIEEVVAANKVHGSLKEWADAIRLVGNSGAHVGDDGLEVVTQDEAEDILAFTEEFLGLTYVARERVRQRLAARTGPAES